MEHLITVLAVLVAATFVTGVILPLTSGTRRGAANRQASDDTTYDEVAAAQLATSR